MVRQSLLSQRISTVQKPPTIRDMPGAVENDLKLTAIKLDKNAKKERKRRFSADASELKNHMREDAFKSQEEKEMDDMKI